ncbi:MAG: hypothetical protein A3B89_03880 [Candidatus Buchananbacteria bacterium RIFCSPHIGHO2_02_FULL_40_13]|uniref:Uncharacterized protein n=1 Tax=Candidatus Buchananbacteria bacterium RIFCSPLOWO2_01_FULL_39_33 TaxID=1797543 RepID=A0A1G1YJZ4_9BACT|nr:MAG: hypothetical protein A2820_02475 [Candidatus Buchananbacteria bacterium RIFCSPHIGHO2_01_FULL_40_35]OGY50700.1 MAG: hypothetical protein A3B89_03880 [Candidatus Buchananbacteria bacterium RIFCSPHIGHO2_02_FULL_40_13]OGY52629.1 MAG: hypothetical protein A3A02_03850 [Candidatus Buchananbacteria bacterium RIFCSPLOWO2_01_FULL_39_33]
MSVWLWLMSVHFLGVFILPLIMSFDNFKSYRGYLLFDNRWYYYCKVIGAYLFWEFTLPYHLIRCWLGKYLLSKEQKITPKFVLCDGAIILDKSSKDYRRRYKCLKCCRPFSSIPIQHEVLNPKLSKLYNSRLYRWFEPSVFNALHRQDLKIGY